MSTTAIGLITPRKSPNESPAAEPIMMFGGSPIRVAAPPMFEAKITPSRYGSGIHLEVVREVQEHGRHEQDRGHVVEQGRDDRREDHEEDEEPERAVPGGPGRADREPVEEARVAGERDDHHHPGKEQEGVEVEVVGDPVPGDEPGSDRDHPARDRRDRAMDPLVHDQRVYHEKERDGGERGERPWSLSRIGSARGRLRLVPHVQELRRRDIPHGPHPGPPRPPGRRGRRAPRAAARAGHDCAVHGSAGGLVGRARLRPGPRPRGPHRGRSRPARPHGPGAPPGRALAPPVRRGRGAAAGRRRGLRRPARPRRDRAGGPGRARGRGGRPPAAALPRGLGDARSRAPGARHGRARGPDHLHPLHRARRRGAGHADRVPARSTTGSTSSPRAARSSPTSSPTPASRSRSTTRSSRCPPSSASSSRAGPPWSRPGRPSTGEALAAKGLAPERVRALPVLIDLVRIDLEEAELVSSEAQRRGYAARQRLRL